MPITDPLRTPIYESGGLIQQCDACGWAQRGHGCELPECPECATPLKAPLAIEFGGLTVLFRGKHFDFHDNNGRFVAVQAADHAAVIQFLCKHATDYRSDTPHREPGMPQSIAYSREFWRHFRGVRDA